MMLCTDKGAARQTVVCARPKCITKMEYEYFRGRAQQEFINDKAKEKCYNVSARAKLNLLEQSAIRKERMRDIDMKKLHGKSLKLKELDDEAKVQTMHLLERANNLKIEQEEEILLCNKLILETKCRAIRDLQVAEKKLIATELRNEDKRIGEVMESKKKLLLEEEKREAEEIEAKRRVFARLLKNQIIENDEQRIIEFERKQEEARLTNLDNIAWQEEEIYKANKIKQQNEWMQREAALQNAALINIKEIEREENRQLDMRIQKFQREKEERDRNFSEAQRLAKAKKDAQRLKIATKTMQTYNLQDQIDELNVARAKEEVEREWRNREKAEALKKLETRRKFAEAREEQINCRRALQAMEMERDRREFERILKIQGDAMEREEKLRAKRKNAATQHRNQILKQVDDKAKEKIQERKKIIEEGLAINMQIQMRANQLKDAIRRKCNEMRQNKVPEIYINHVKTLIDKIK